MKLFKLLTLTSLFVFTVISGVCITKVSAHVLRFDHNIAAELHIPPDDRPISNAPTTLELTFSDNANKLRLSSCDCILKINLQGQNIITKPLNIVNELSAKNIVVFPKPGIYSLSVVGNPKQTGTFQPFIISYQVNISGVNSSSKSFPLILGFALALMVCLVVLAAYKSQKS